METASLGIYGAELEMLAGHARGHHLAVGSVMGGLVLRHQDAELVVTCRPYAVDGGRLWFFSEPDETALGEADPARTADVIVAIKGKLAAS